MDVAKSAIKDASSDLIKHSNIDSISVALSMQELLQAIEKSPPTIEPNVTFPYIFAGIRARRPKLGDSDIEPVFLDPV